MSFNNRSNVKQVDIALNERCPLTTGYMKATNLPQLYRAAEFATPPQRRKAAEYTEKFQQTFLNFTEPLNLQPLRNAAKRLNTLRSSKRRLTIATRLMINLSDPADLDLEKTCADGSLTSIFYRSYGTAKRMPLMLPDTKLKNFKLCINAHMARLRTVM
ncbi:hypothetical protein QE152_g19098 [Popillia japonica]|uniref:Uncharacterized protein n=1 Tax=Popillia japonica TaxID=7064 RepID=A0AAW1L349_POPJA